jgi:hypothetical protein
MFDMSEMVGQIAPDREKVIRTMVRYRNQIVHNTEGLRPRAGGQYGLARLRAIASLLVQERLLRALGCASERAAECIARTWEFRWAQRATGQDAGC